MGAWSMALQHERLGKPLYQADYDAIPPARGIPQPDSPRAVEPILGLGL